VGDFKPLEYGFHGGRYMLAQFACSLRTGEHFVMKRYRKSESAAPACALPVPCQGIVHHLWHLLDIRRSKHALAGQALPVLSSQMPRRWDEIW
jgi:hypothetical protein